MGLVNMASALAVVVMDNEGRIIDYAAPLDIGFSKIKEATRIGFDIYRTVSFILKSLGYDLPKNITIHYPDTEIVVIPKGNHVVISITFDLVEAPKAITPEVGVTST